MINIQNKVDCCGCNACGDACAKGAISFKTDIEGFWYPEVDQSKCVDCGLCEKVCPIINVEALKKNDFEKPECHAAIHKNIEIRFDSTSGGMFSAFAQAMYKQGGYVGGAIWTEDWGVQQFISSSKDDLARLRSSKYLQSDAQGFYKAVRDLLRQGEKVLVCGTPCQMSALRAFLRKPYDNLIIVDFICRGINSPKVWHKYIEYQEEKHGAKVVYVKPKNKELGWRELTTKLVFKNGKVLYDTKDTSFFTIGYLQTGVYCRPSCYDCKFKGFPRIADITIADYWGAEKTVGKDLDNDMGTSLVMLNSQKGKDYFETIKDKLHEKEIPFESTLKGNPALTKPLNPPIVDRNDFYTSLDKNGFKGVVGTYIQRGLDRPISRKNKLKNIARFGVSLRRLCGMNIGLWIKNIRYNLFCSAIKTNICENKYVKIYSDTIIEIHKGSKIELGGILTLGWKKFKHSHLETRLLIDSGGCLLLHGNYSFGYGSDIEIFQDALLEIDGGGATNIGATIICGEKIKLGERVMIGRNCTIRDNNGNHYIARRGYKNTHPVIIGKHAWLCESCTLIAGANIGDGAIIGAKAVVAGKVPSFSLVLGNPAQIVDENVYWKY